MIQTVLTDGGRWLLAASAVGGFALQWGNRFIGLSGGSVHGLNPQHPVLLIVTGKHHQITFSYGIKKHTAAL